ncbi:hypothetical protein S7335_4867 [Synechococcus sp. PCC 7335]|nr:hypothetical protein S7335_4867 [Synechococcus sp. PCC 7335]
MIDFMRGRSVLAEYKSKMVTNVLVFPVSLMAKALGVR